MVFRAPRFHLRTLLIAVAVIALPLGSLAVRSSRLSRRAMASAQLNLQVRTTTAAWAEIQAELEREVGNPISAGGATSASGGPDRQNWTTEMKVWAGSGPSRRPLVRLTIQGGWDGGAIRPVTVRDLRAPYNGRAIERLTGAYNRQRWRYRVVPPQPE
jgi:hypothetical protein